MTAAGTLPPAWRAWLYDGWEDPPMVLLTLVVSYAALVLLTRLSGLRAFSKMSAFDFTVTVAIGSLFGATVAAPSPRLLTALTALTGMFLVQRAVAAARARWSAVSKALDNEPLLLMAGPRVLHGNLRRSGVSEDDLRAKLREANVLRFEQVRAVVLETTGDVSVLHGDSDEELDADLLEGVRDAGRLTNRLSDRDD